MASANYITGRKKYSRPQALLLANNPGTVSPEGFYIPDGNELYSQEDLENINNEAASFIILSDDNRGPINFNIERIENRQRMINGRMRSYHIADKISISASWEMLPSRSFSSNPQFNSEGASLLRSTGERSPGTDGSFKQLPNITSFAQQYTTDGGAGGGDILDWYENNPGSFWVYLAYDKKNNFGDGSSSYNKLQQYNEIIEVFFSNFEYSVVRRGSNNYDFWNISFTLEEV
jgi:hypothetical protein